MHEKNCHTEAQRLCQPRIQGNIQRLKIAQVAPASTTKPRYQYLHAENPGRRLLMRCDISNRPWMLCRSFIAAPINFGINPGYGRIFPLLRL